MTSTRLSLSPSSFTSIPPESTGDFVSFYIQHPSNAVAGLGYSLNYDACGLHGTSCQDTCGTAYEPCWKSDESIGNLTGCYNPSMGDICCRDVKAGHLGGAVCAGGYYCVEDVDTFQGGLFCCKEVCIFFASMNRSKKTGSC